MSSRKLSDKEFDRYTRNILKKPEGIAFDKAAWASMEQQMAKGGASSSPFNLKWIIPAGLIILSSIAYLGYRTLGKSDQEITQLTEQASPIEESINDGVVITDSGEETDSSASSESASVATIIPGKGIAKQNTEAGVNDPASIKNEKITGIAAKEISGSTPRKSANKTRTEKSVTAPSERSIGEIEEKSESVSEKTIIQEESGSFTNNRTYAEDPPDTNNEDVGPKVERLDNTISNTSEESSESEDSNSWIVAPLHAFFPLSEIEQPEIILYRGDEPNKSSVQSQAVSNDEEETSAFGRWSVGVVLAPDFSTVGGQFNEFTRPGMDAGVTVEYFISRRLSITTGAILTRKLYNTTDIEEYTVPPGFWNGGDSPEEILADCNVIDIPVNLRYRVVEGKRTNFFLSAGISSYLMLNERYDYDYGYGGNNGSQPTGWEVSNENNHFFGVYNLSAGISRQVGKHLFIEAEPFLKNSLGGVGWGQVRLRSTGALLHLKYHF